MSESLEDNVEKKQNSGEISSGIGPFVSGIFTGVAISAITAVIGLSFLAPRVGGGKDVRAFEKPIIYQTKEKLDVQGDNFYYSVREGVEERLSESSNQRISVTYMDENGDELVDAVRIYFTPVNTGELVSLRYTREDNPQLAIRGDILIAYKRREYAQYLPQVKRVATEIGEK